MDKESANWCRIAQTIMQRGGEVLRQFLLLEILTQNLNIYTPFWMEEVRNPGGDDYLFICLCQFNAELLQVRNPSEKQILSELIKSWRRVHGKPIPLMDQIDILKQWKNDIGKQRENLAPGSVNTTLNSWLTSIDDYINKLMAICTLTNQWNITFHDHLQNAQSDILLQIEEIRQFLYRCNCKLKSLSIPSSSEFEQLVQNFKKDLEIWKTKCREIFQGFCNKCQNMISLGLKETKNCPINNKLDTFLISFQNKLNNCNLQSQVDLFCDNWEDAPHKIFDEYEKQINKDMSTEAVSNLAHSLSKKLEKVSFEESRIRSFFRSFKQPKLPRHFEIQCSKLQNISTASDLNEFDFTMIMIVWRNGKLVHSPLQEYDEDPHEWDTSISADVGHLRTYRNSIVAHIAQLKISNETFEQLWKELTLLLRKIASRCGDQFKTNIIWEIDQMKECSFEPCREYQLQKKCLTWCKKDILAQLSASSRSAPQCLDMLQSIETALEKLARSRQVCSCRICHNDFFKESELAEHMRRHQDCRCLACPKIFSTENELQNHMSCHQDRRCRMCNMDFSTDWEFRRHMWCNQDCRCLCCDEEFPTEKDFVEHMAYHLAFKCGICKTGWSKESDLCQHFLRHQARTCLSCRNDFSDDQMFEQHMSTHQARTCRSCIKDFSTARDLEEHMTCHPDYACRTCDQEFSTDSELAEHTKEHTECLNPVFIPATAQEPILFSAAECATTGTVGDENQKSEVAAI